MDSSGDPEPTAPAPAASPSEPLPPLREFARKVCRYFLDFLESDFKRTSAPRRRIQLKNDAGFRTAIPLRKYPSLAETLWKLMHKPVGEGLTLNIAPRRHTAAISPLLLNVIEQHVASIPDARFQKVGELLLKLAEQTHSEAAEHPEAYIERVQLGFAELVAREFVAPLLTMLEGVFRDQAYSAVESIYEIETDLVDTITEPVNRNLPTALATWLVKRDLGPTRDVLSDFFDPRTVRERLTGFFAEFATADAFQEVRDLIQYASTSDQLQFYVYLVDLRFAAHTYPVFYLPVSLELREDPVAYHLTLDPHLYVNKRAIDYVQQEREHVSTYNALSPVDERIVYLEPEQRTLEVMRELMNRLVPALDLPDALTLDGGGLRQQGTAQLRVSSAAYLAVFDRSDESLLNDYEELLAAVHADAAGVQGLFESIVNGFILDEPKSILQDIEAQWDATPIHERLVAESPIPINDEQRKIIAAVHSGDCRFIAVSGPPGCGKSHTITAIAFDCILAGRSTLILSDKKEALDVVQDKLEDALSSVRHGEEFPNPILRLGKSGGTYQRLIQQSAQQRIREQARAHRSHEGRLNAERQQSEAKLKRDIELTVSTLSAINMSDLAELHALETGIERAVPDLLPSLRTGIKTHQAMTPMPPDREAELLLKLMELKLPIATGHSLRQSLRLMATAGELVQRFTDADRATLRVLPKATPEHAIEIAGVVARYEKLRMPLFGFLFRKAAILELNGNLAARFGSTEGLTLHKRLRLLRAMPALLERVAAAADHNQLQATQHAPLCRLVANGVPLPAEQARALAVELDRLESITSEAAFAHPLLTVGAPTCATPAHLLAELRRCARYSDLYKRISAAMKSVPEFDYVAEKKKLERIHVSRMANELDRRFLNFVEQKAATAKSLGGVIKKGAKFPTEAFAGVGEAFPCIIAGIREFAEYVPLKANIFDVVIIDEASQVSVAQAFPALLRARKVVVFGDAKQFSNVKSMNASNALNAGYLTDLDAYFRRKISTAADRIERLKMFDVKRSVLSFMELVASYPTMLTKHFRGYQELISFSSTTFYDGQLQAIKVRGVPIEDVIAFYEVTPEPGDRGKLRNTNRAEGHYILGRLRELLPEDKNERNEDTPSVGVITPFREQQQLLTRLCYDDTDGERFLSELKLKIMTFDSCQGEERDLILYSLVATRENDKLNYVFPVEITTAPEQVEEQLKLQRLNVGFSRAKEAIEFVLSKPIEEYKGSIRKVLQHYHRLLVERSLPEAADTDPASPMEKKVLDWLQKAPFYQRNAANIEVVAQFRIGDYLRQLDRHYQHPRFRTDFLVRYHGGARTVQVIIEYDGLKEHFDKVADVNAFNFETYYRPQDVERQMVIESYGYKFLRINRFNLGEDPVTTLSERLERLVGDAMNGGTTGNGPVDDIRASAREQANGTAKQCPNCETVKPLAAFYDPSLRNGSGGHGRICASCKGGAGNQRKTASGAFGKGPNRRRRYWRR